LFPIQRRPDQRTHLLRIIPYTECGFVWAREPLAELSKEFDDGAESSAAAGERLCRSLWRKLPQQQGEVVRFLAMETDFYVTLEVKDLEDKRVLGELIEQVLGVVSEFPVEETPGPQPGYVGITFEAPSDELRLWFTQLKAQAAIDNGLRGEELFNKSLRECLKSHEIVNLRSKADHSIGCVANFRKKGCKIGGRSQGGRNETRRT
jgi:hypothetical protein